MQAPATAATLMRAGIFQPRSCLRRLATNTTSPLAMTTQPAIPLRKIKPSHPRAAEPGVVQAGHGTEQTKCRRMPQDGALLGSAGAVEGNHVRYHHQAIIDVAEHVHEASAIADP